MKSHACLVGLCLVSLELATASSALALANRVFVSARSGNNANACDNIGTPCQTFAGAVLQLSPGGEAIVLDSGGYGPVTITQSLTIEAPAGVVAFVHPPSGDAITVNAPGGTVVLRGLVLSGGSGAGIVVTAVSKAHVENCVVSGFVGLGISYDAPGSSLFVKDSIFRGDLDGAAIFGGRASFDRCRFESNNGSGLIVVGGDATVRESVAAGNAASGFAATSFSSANSVLNVYACVSTNNQQDGVVGQKTSTGFVIVRVANSSISENFGVGLNNLANSVTLESLGNNFVRGNLGGQSANTITPVGGL